MLRLTKTARIKRATGSPVAPAYDPPGDELRCDLQPLTQAVAFERWGVELREPYRLFGRLDDFSSVTVNDRIVADTTEYAIAAPARVWRSGLVTDHVELILEKIQND